MVYRGKVKKGVVVLEKGASLPDGTIVQISPVNEKPAEPTLADRLKDVIGAARGLPKDLAKNHDHYLHGRRKR